MADTLTTDTFKAALIQMCSGRNVEENLAAAESEIRAAHAAGAHYIQTPENTNLLDYKRDHQNAVLQPQKGNAAVAHFASLAKELGVWLHIGGMGIKLEDNLFANRAFVFNPAGQLMATYDKVHMFDVNLPSGESYRESKAYRPGTKAVVVDTPWGGLGISICYDLRFAYLYRALAHAGAAFITAPSAFTRQTGKAHWEVLLRARAIETGSFMFAAAQCGTHESGRETYGHSLIINPWGEILAEAGDEPGWIIADIDPTLVKNTRERMPVLTHDRDLTVDNPIDI